MPVSRIIPYCLLFLLLAASAGCKKDEDKQPSRTELLTAGKWKVTALPYTPVEDIDGDGTNDPDLFPFVEPCNQDDLISFKSDGTAEWDEGATKCNPSDPQTFSSTWAFVNEEKEFLLDGEKATIVELTNTTFRIRFSDDTTTPASTLEMVFTKQ